MDENLYVQNSSYCFWMWEGRLQECADAGQLSSHVGWYACDTPDHAPSVTPVESAALSDNGVVESLCGIEDVLV